MRRYRPVRSRRRRRRRSARTYTLTELLQRQPKTLQKHAEYPLLLIYLRNAAELQRVRLSRSPFRLLHDARIEAHNLPHFYRTYRLPQHPFFPHFLRIKRGYLAERERIREARNRYILEQMRSLPEPVVGFIRYLGYLENHYNAAAAHPLWDQHLFPSSKKQVHQYHGYSLTEWIELFRGHMHRLERRYRAFKTPTGERLVASFVLECVAPEFPPRRPDPALVKRRYRELSLRYHPDHGGDAEAFRELKRARDLLVQ